MNRSVELPVQTLGSLFAAIALAQMAVADDAVLLTEQELQSRSFDVTQNVSIKGTLQTSTGDGKAVALPLKALAEFKYTARRLTSGGRDASSLREARSYGQATSQIEVSSQKTTTSLRENRRQAVVLGKREGVDPFSLNGSLAYSELELLSAPGDALAIAALLPPRAVDIGESWTPTDWAGQMLLGLDAVLKQKLECRLESVQKGQAIVAFSGTAEGAVDGSVTNVTISGSFRYDIAQKHIGSWELTQQEKRTVGTVSPGMEVVAKIVAQRKASESPSSWTDARIAQIPLEPPAQLLRLSLEPSWPTRIRLHYARGWHLFHETERVAVLRLLDEGSLIAQCNVSPVPSVPAGEHTSEKQFQDDIQTSLGDKFGMVKSTKQIKTDDGRFLFRIAVSGKSSGLSMNWHYYLCSAPSGQQVSFVFAYEPKALQQLGERDVEIVKNLQFLSSSK